MIILEFYLAHKNVDPVNLNTSRLFAFGLFLPPPLVKRGMTSLRDSKSRHICEWRMGKSAACVGDDDGAAGGIKGVPFVGKPPVVTMLPPTKHLLLLVSLAALVATQVQYLITISNSNRSSRSSLLVVY